MLSDILTKKRQLYTFLNNVSFLLQASREGPRRVPVSQQTQMAIVAPTPQQRVLGVSNGPQRVQRPVGHQKPTSHVSVAVKSTQPSDQNVNPAVKSVNSTPQAKPGSQQSQPKMHVAKENCEQAKPPSELANVEKPQSKYNINLN